MRRSSTLTVIALFATSLAGCVLNWDPLLPGRDGSVADASDVNGDGGDARDAADVVDIVDAGPTCGLPRLPCCGGAGGTCSGGSSCQGGTCNCTMGTTACASSCADLQTSATNCGSCGHACATGEMCTRGACIVTPCPTMGETRCSGTCVNLQADVANCGTCAHACASGETCQGGVCALPPCTGGLMRCSGTCVNTQSDNANCGSCGHACGTGESCMNGTCRIMCSTGLTLCGATCVDTQTNAANCGMCGRPCMTGEICTAGTCGFAPCPTGQMRCGSTCIDVSMDPAHCGSCSITCNSTHNTPMCVSSVCQIGSCDPGWGDCNTSGSDGCETNTQNSVANCGACNNACPSGPNSRASCTTGTCGFTCDTGFADCDINPATGCEQNTATDVLHCGSCTNACALANATPQCISGTCRIMTCLPGFADCDGMPGNGCEVDTRTNNLNCGTCNNRCMGSRVCVAGACV